MARIRTIKPEFFTSEDVVALSPLARLLYVAMWCEADREGRLDWKPVTFKLRYLPGDDCDIQKVCQEIVDQGLVIPYEADGKQFAEIPGFTKHQVINNREAESSIPARVDHASYTRHTRVSDASCGKGKEGKGKEGKGTRDASRDFDPVKHCPPNVTPDTWAKFCSHRSETRKPLKKTMTEEIAKSLVGLSPDDADACVLLSVRNGWQGIFPERMKGGNKPPGGETPRQRAERLAAEFQAEQGGAQ